MIPSPNKQFLEETLCSLGRFIRDEKDIDKIKKIIEKINYDEQVVLNYNIGSRTVSVQENIIFNLARRLDKSVVFDIIDSRWIKINKSANTTLYSTLLSEGYFGYCLTMIDKFLAVNPLKVIKNKNNEEGFFLAHLLSLFENESKKFESFFDFYAIDNCSQEEYFYPLFDKIIEIKKILTGKNNISINNDLVYFIKKSAEIGLEKIFIESIDRLPFEQLNDPAIIKAIFTGANPNIINYYTKKTGKEIDYSCYNDINIGKVVDQLILTLDDYYISEYAQYKKEKLYEFLLKHLAFIKNKQDITPAQWGVIQYAKKKEYINKEIYAQILKKSNIPHKYPNYIIVENKGNCYEKLKESKVLLAEREWNIFEFFYYNIFKNKKTKLSLDNYNKSEINNAVAGFAIYTETLYYNKDEKKSIFADVEKLTISSTIKKNTNINKQKI